MEDVKLLRRKRISIKPLERGEVKKNTTRATLNDNESPFKLSITSILGFGLMAAVFSVVFMYLYSATAPTHVHSLKQLGSPAAYSAYLAYHAAIIIGVLFFSFPMIKTAFYMVTHFRLPPPKDMSKFSNYYVFFLVNLSAIILYIVNPVLIEAIWHFSVTGISAGEAIYSIFLFFCILCLLFFYITIIDQARRDLGDAFSTSLALFTRSLFGEEVFKLFLGQSTGYLTERQHGSGIAPNQNIIMSLNDAVLNVLVLGGIGTGKTSAVINPLLIQLLDQKIGGLIFDIKGSFKRTVHQFAKDTKREIEYIGPNHKPMNIIEGLTPETAGEYIRAALMLHGTGGGQEKHWLNAATILATNVLGILSFVRRHYTLEGLHRFLYEKEFRENLQVEIDEWIAILGKQNPHNQRILKHYLNQYETVFAGGNEKYQKDVMSTMDEVLSPFSHPDISDAFCAVNERMPDMKEVMYGKIYLLDMLLDDWGMAGKIVYLLMKLRFFSVIKHRQALTYWNQTNPVFFMCDEYQEIVDCSNSSLSDLNFWDKAKDAKCIGIITAQSINSFYSKIGDKNSANTVLQNFRQKLCLKTEDPETLKYFEYLGGRVEVEKEHYGENRGHSSGSNKTNYHHSTNRNVTSNEKLVIDSQLFRLLGADQAIACLSIDRRSMDDVIDLHAVYV